MQCLSETKTAVNVEKVEVNVKIHDGISIVKTPAGKMLTVICSANLFMLIPNIRLSMNFRIWTVQYNGNEFCSLVRMYTRLLQLAGVCDPNFHTYGPTQIAPNQKSIGGVLILYIYTVMIASK